ncbi:mRNA cleavage and polyadenylation specificity factor complex subunit [Metarhizium acridum CQMa 102]|uniref:mRNA cleavage and polyadenylation specificity factor complex subunit n=1 Tax=Metarhizium acridum (strain CQMa 102) TaxID=655827 RepID=E9E004_METAQ|nr:mRNA cleavage and polyadenylation specificity factor complex subunit [Metarhizium acridum CQMa 102]EFY90839.1 mRNA cleavage and polyadenylation specificity factor complex subunit [Metarhizium acridum CQMa 102]
MSSNLSVPEQIRQLNDARKLVLGDVKYYPNVVRGLLPIIGPNAQVELRRWGAEFLAEAFSTPALPNGEKETMQLYVLATVESLLQNEREDPQVLRSVILTAASIYPLALRWMISCIKFAQRVVLAQTVSTGAEFRHAGTLDISLDKVPPNHQSLDPRNLEAEASGLLDRMLVVLQESTDALLVDATLNSLSILVRTRPATSSRILNALLSFNPLQLANSPLTPKSKVMIKSMEKTARLLLLHLTKRDPHNPMVPRIHQHIERMMHMVMEVLDDSGRKRPREAQQHDGYDAKRQRVAESYIPQIPPLGSGPHSLADMFTLVGHDGLKSFDLSQVPAAMIAKVTVTALSRIDSQLLSKAVDGVRGRLTTLANAPAPELNPNTAPLGVDEDDDDYEPDFYQAEDTEQILNKLDGASAPLPAELTALDSSLALASFSLPQPAQLTPEMALSAGSGTVAKVVDMMKSLEEPAAKKHKAGFIRLAASSGSKDAWMTILTRLATRASTGLEEISVKGEEDESSRQPSLGNNIREVIYNYVMEDFRKHIDVAVSWLCEEWYNDKMQARLGGDYPRNYEKNTLRLINGFLPYLHPQDKVLTRFLSEIPELNRTMLSRVKDMCRDPSVTQLALTSLLYLAMMRPPVKELALDTVQDIWTEFEDARPMASKYLSKYRPGFVEAAEAKANRDSACLESSGTAIAT